MKSAARGHLPRCLRPEGGAGIVESLKGGGHVHRAIHVAQIVKVHARRTHRPTAWIKGLASA